MPGRSVEEQDRKLFIGGLTYSTTDEQLKDYFSQWGEVIDYIVMRDTTTRRSRGFGFITYSESHMLDDAMTNRPHVIDNKTVESKRAVPREFGNKPENHMTVKKLYVSGVKGDEISENMLRDYFSQYGDIETVDIMIDKQTGERRGFCFITFVDYDAVDKCVLQKSHMIGGKRCDVKKALSKEELKKIDQQGRDRSERGDRSRGPGAGYGGGGGPGMGGHGGGPWGPGPQGGAAGGGGYGQGGGGGYGGGRSAPGPYNNAGPPQGPYGNAPANYGASYGGGAQQGAMGGGYNYNQNQPQPQGGYTPSAGGGGYGSGGGAGVPPSSGYYGGSSGNYPGGNPQGVGAQYNQVSNGASSGFGGYGQSGPVGGAVAVGGGQPPQAVQPAYGGGYGGGAGPWSQAPAPATNYGQAAYGSQPVSYGSPGAAAGANPYGQSQPAAGVPRDQPTGYRGQPSQPGQAPVWNSQGGAYGQNPPGSFPPAQDDGRYAYGGGATQGQMGGNAQYGSGGAYGQGGGRGGPPGGYY